MIRRFLIIFFYLMGNSESIVYSQEFFPLDTMVLTGQNPFEVDHLPVDRAKSFTEEKSIILDEESNFLFIVFILSLIFLSIAIGDDKKTFAKGFRALNNSNFLKLFLRDSSNYFPTVLYFLYFYALVSLSLFLYFLNKSYPILNDNIEGYYLEFGVLMGSLVLLFSAKQLVIRSLGYVFFFSNEPKLYNFSMMLVVIATGLLMTPINAILAFGSYFSSEFMLILGLSTLVFFYIFQQIKGLVFARHFLLYNTFHFFLYICTVELLPLLILAKIVRF
jgi:hypothetical protein